MPPRLKHYCRFMYAHIFCFDSVLLAHMIEVTMKLNSRLLTFDDSILLVPYNHKVGDGILEVPYRIETIPDLQLVTLFIVLWESRIILKIR
jgi:hypothetical protein